MLEFKASDNQTQLEKFEYDSLLYKEKLGKEAGILTEYFNLLNENIQNDNHNEVLCILKHVQIDKKELRSSRVLSKFLAENKFFFIFLYCLDAKHNEIAKISINLLHSMIQQSRVLDTYIFDSRIINCLFELLQLNDTEINMEIAQICTILSQHHPEMSFIFWDFMKSISDSYSTLDLVSEFIYNEVIFFCKNMSFLYSDLFTVMTNILTKNNQIANGNILMAIKKGIDHDIQEFINYFIDDTFIQMLLEQINISNLKSIKRESLILLTSFIPKLNQTIKFPLLDIKLILRLLNDQTLIFSILRYLNSIVIFHPSILFIENLPQNFDITLLIYEVLKKYNREVPFKIKTEASNLIALFIDKKIINITFLTKNYSQIFAVLLDYISIETIRSEFFILVLIEVCNQLITVGIKKDLIQQIFDENDAQNILDDCLAKSKDLIAHIQLLNNIVYS